MSSPSPYDVTSLFRVDNLVAVVTGGGTGIGLNFAKALDANGAKAVYIVGRREDKLRAAAASAANGTLIPVVGDVTSQESLKAVAERVRQEQGYVNVVLANAGVDGFTNSAVGGKKEVPAKELVDAYWGAGMEDMANTLRVNVGGTFFTALAFLELLVAGNAKGGVSQRSQIVVTGSIAGFMKNHPGPGYMASKAASTQLCKWMATVFAPYGVRVNNFVPGLFLSEMSAPFAERLAAGGTADPTVEGALPKTMVPVGRFGTDEELTGSILFLLSKAGGYVNGGILVNDGGSLTQLNSSY